MERITEFIVSEEAFKDTVHIPCYSVPYIKSKNTQFVGEYDFIIIKDEVGNKIIRNYMNDKDGKLQYTTCFDGDNCSDISLCVVMTFLYQSIMWIRHETAKKKKIVLRSSFSVERLKKEMMIIESVLDLCERKIKIQEFVDILESYENHIGDMNFTNVSNILAEYEWTFELSQLRKEKIDVIKNAMDEIRYLLDDKSKWNQIWRVGYRIHNEPYFIFEDTNVL